MYMFRQSWLGTVIEIWVLRTGWNILRTIVTLVLMTVVALAAGITSFFTTVLCPLAVQLTTRALVEVELTFLEHRDWPSLGLFPFRASWQRLTVAALMWSVGALLLLIVWFLASVMLAGHVPRLPMLSRVALLLTVSGILGALAAASGARSHGGGISLG
jgi:hypothetical protein